MFLFCDHFDELKRLRFFFCFFPSIACILALFSLTLGLRSVPIAVRWPRFLSPIFCILLFAGVCIRFVARAQILPFEAAAAVMLTSGCYSAVGKSEDIGASVGVVTIPWAY